MKQLIIQPRRTGKTTWLLDQFLENVKKRECYFVCISYAESTRIKIILYNKYGFKYNDTIMRYIITVDQFYSDKLLYKIGKDAMFCIDEYFFFKNREIFTIGIIDNNLDFVAISTSNKLYNKDAINAIRHWRSIQQSLCEFNGNSIYKNKNEMIEYYGYDLFLNFLSYPEVEVIEWDDYRLSAWPKEQYEIEVLGKLYE